MNFDFCAHLYNQTTEFKSTSSTRPLNVRGAVRLLGKSCHQQSSSAVDRRCYTVHWPVRCDLWWNSGKSVMG